MAQYEIDINNCGASPSSQTLKVGDQVKFCSTDSRSYKVTGLGNVFEDGHGHRDVPAGGCTQYYTVNGTKGNYGYSIGPDCPPLGTPEIIIDD
jgi:plastocyanin